MKIISSLNILRKAILLSVLFLVFNCKKDTNFIGSELQNEDLGLLKSDNFLLTTFTKKADSLRADEISVSSLGSYNDPVFGKTNSSFYTQLRIPVDNVDFALGTSLSNLVLDSVILSIEYRSHYGNLDPQTFEVYELMDDIIKDSNYFNGKTFTNKGVDLVEAGKGLITPNPSSTVEVDGDTLPAQLRIPLDKSFGQAILNESGNSTLANNDNFGQFIKGIEVKVNNPSQSTSEGGIFLVDLISSNTKIRMYYRDTVNKDTSTFDLLINENSARVNFNEHDYTGTDIDAQLNDSALGANNIYIQGLQGLKSEIHLDDILRYKDSNIIVNKALLTMPVEYTTGDVFEPNSQLLIIRNEDNLKYFLPDQTMFGGQAGLDNVGGKWNEDLKQYEFLVTRYVNNVLNGNFPNNNLTLETTSSMVNPNRVIMSGSNSSLTKPKLTIIYTKY